MGKYRNLANQKPLMGIVLVQTCPFHFLSMLFWDEDARQSYGVLKSTSNLGKYLCI